MRNFAQRGYAQEIPMCIPHLATDVVGGTLTAPRHSKCHIILFLSFISLLSSFLGDIMTTLIFFSILFYEGHSAHAELSTCVEIPHRLR